MRLLKTFGAFVLTAGAFLAGCGGTTNNDQGLSVTFLGYIADADNCDGDHPNSSGATEPFSTTTENGTLAGGIVAGMLIQNNLSSQHIITQNAFFEYYVPGASAQPPATSSVLGQVIPAAVSTTAEDGSITVEPSTGCGETFIVPAEVRTWMLLNRQSLPEPPFTMEVRAYVSLISSAGDRFDTNEVKYQVQFTPDIIIDAGDGSGSEGDGSTDGGTTDGSGTDSTGTDGSTSGDGSSADGTGTDGTGTGDSSGTGSETDGGEGL